LAATVSWVWVHLLGFQAVVAWQLWQLVLPTGMCAVCLPVPAVPSWQLAQFVEALKTEWSTLAPVQVVTPT
jgi:hypothetical protein